MLPPLYAAHPATPANRRDGETEPIPRRPRPAPKTLGRRQRWQPPRRPAAPPSRIPIQAPSNSGTAVDDYFCLSAACLTGKWDVMANDGGGTKTVMYSLDD